jgi:predicted DNA-binding transcriptional regulator AlpA
MSMQSRVIRAKDAPGYLGMSRDVFNRDVRPYITVIPIGNQGIGFDRLELDAWLEHYKQCNGRSAVSKNGGSLCRNVSPCQDSSLEGVSGTSANVTSISREGDFAKALALVKKTSTKRKRA